MKKYLFIFVVILFVSCFTEDKTEKNIASVPIDFEIIRFDKIFGTANTKDIPELKRKYPVFFPIQYHDSIWVQKILDTLQQQLYREVINKFPTDEKLHSDLLSLFQHIKYYFPQFKSPLVITIISDVDYKNKVITSDSLLIVSLDTYLGSNHPFYDGIPKYFSQNMKESQITPDIATSYAKQLISKPQHRFFLAQMIYFGKELYLKELWLPHISDAEKIGYTKDEFKWVEENETEIWRNFVENEILYSTDPKLTARFLNPAPFSKFYLEIDNDSPGRVGRYMGWQIVRSYMKKNPVKIHQLMMQDANQIFKKSKYKPKK